MMLGDAKCSVLGRKVGIQNMLSVVDMEEKFTILLGKNNPWNRKRNLINT